MKKKIGEKFGNWTPGEFNPNNCPLKWGKNGVQPTQKFHPNQEFPGTPGLNSLLRQKGPPVRFMEFGPI